MNQIATSIRIITAIALPASLITGCATESPEKKNRPHVQLVNAPADAKRTKLTRSHLRTDNGCWVHIYEDAGFGDANDTIGGPGKWNNMRNLPAANKQDWGDQIDSLIVGPHARVFLWEDEGFGDDRIEFGPNSIIKDLNEYGFGDDADSMEIVYVP